MSSGATERQRSMSPIANLRGSNKEQGTYI